mmetsp:Transcript_25118/g.28621  ORF Transcript_25118/g.28621 Transcript_25118/m.28621 type:complete len:204 (-) Transcript_25118:518-1129(-)
MLPTIALFFILPIISAIKIPLLPVVVIKISPHSTTSSSLEIVYPSIQACRAQIGSISVTYTTQPLARMAAAHPLPTSPYPQMTAFFPAIIISVARIKPSGNECLHPYKLSNLDLVTESFTLIAGKRSFPSFSIVYKRCTPVVVSSETPTHLLAILFHLSVTPASNRRLIIVKTILNSALSVEVGSGTVLPPDSLKTSSAFLPS